MDQLKKFADTVADFNKLPLSVQIDCFSYFWVKIQKNSHISPKIIANSFEFLGLPKYTNISSYLLRNKQRSRKKIPKYFSLQGGYAPTPQLIEDLEKNILNKQIIVVATSNLYPIELFQTSRKYVLSIAEQAAISFDIGLYDACSVLLRRLTETLIIEAFERKGIESQLKDPSDNYFYLSDLINICISTPKINLSRNSKKALPVLKDLGDLSAHNRRYLAKKTDLESKKQQMRIVFEELLHIIDYSSWH